MATPGGIEERLHVFTDQEVKRILHSQIDAIRRNVELPIRIGSPYGSWGDGHSRPLFSFTRGKYSYLKDTHNGGIGKVESDRLQVLGLETMREYGLDEKIPPQTTADEPFWPKGGIIDDRDGNSREMRLYPSQTIEGLAFKRTRKYNTATGETLSVGWEVIDNSSPFRIPFRGFFRSLLGSKSKK